MPRKRERQRKDTIETREKPPGGQPQSVGETSMHFAVLLSVAFLIVIPLVIVEFRARSRPFRLAVWVAGTILFFLIAKRLT